MSVVYIKGRHPKMPGDALQIALAALGHTVTARPADADKVVSDADYEAFLRASTAGSILLQVMTTIVTSASTSRMEADLRRLLADKHADLDTIGRLVRLQLARKRLPALGGAIAWAVPELMNGKVYARALQVLELAYECKPAVDERLARITATLLPHVDAKAKQALHARIAKVEFPYVHYELARGTHDAQHAVRFLATSSLPGVAMIEALPVARDAKVKRALAIARAERARLDPDDHLAGLFDDAEAMASLYPSLAGIGYPPPSRRPAPLQTSPRELWGRPVPAELAAWFAVLDHWDIGHHTFDKWQAWNPLPSLRSWNPPAQPPAKANAFAWALSLDGASGAWNERAADGTLVLLFANAQPIGRVEFEHGALGVHLDPDGKHHEVVVVDRAQADCHVVAADFATFVTKRKLAAIKSKSRAVAYASRAGWIVDLLLEIPQLQKTVAAHRKHAAHTAELAELWTDKRLIDAPCEALYWMWHLYFTAEDAALARLLKLTAASPSKLVRDSTTIVQKAEFAKQRKAFLAKLGKRGAAVAPPTTTGHATDRRALIAAAKQLTPTYKRLPGKPSATSVGTTIRGMPDTLEDYFEGLADDFTGAHTFATLLAIVRTVGKQPATVIKGDLAIDRNEDRVVYYGDLHVRGDLSFGANVIVLGDLVVDGALGDAEEFLYLWATGSVRTRFFHCRCRTWIGGSLDAAFVLLGRRASIYAGGGVKAELAIRDDDEGEGFQSAVTAKHAVDLWGKRRDADLEKLRALLVPKAFAELEPGLFDSDPLITRAEKGARYLR